VSVVSVVSVVAVLYEPGVWEGLPRPGFLGV